MMLSAMCNTKKCPLVCSSHLRSLYNLAILINEEKSQDVAYRRLSQVLLLCVLQNAFFLKVSSPKMNTKYVSTLEDAWSNTGTEADVGPAS